MNCHICNTINLKYMSNYETQKLKKTSARVSFLA